MPNAGQQVRQVSEHTVGSSYITPVRVATLRTWYQLPNLSGTGDVGLRLTNSLI